MTDFIEYRHRTGEARRALSREYSVAITIQIELVQLEAGKNTDGPARLDGNELAGINIICAGE